MTDRERLQAAIDEALAHLGERAGSSAAATAELPERIVDRTEAAVRKKLGDTIYDLARRCAAADPEVEAFTTFGGAEPASPVALQSSAGRLSTRLAADAQQFALEAPTEANLVPLDRAIHALELLEGVSDSSRYLKCMRAVAAGDWERAASAARELREHASSEQWRRHAHEELIFVLTQSKEFDLASREIEDYLQAYPPNQLVTYNQAFVCSQVGDLRGFRSAARAFRDCEQYWIDEDSLRRVLASQMDELTGASKLSQAAIYEAFGLERA